MEKGEQNPNNVLRNRFSEGDLHHGLIFQGNSIGCLEENALDLSRVILKMNQDSRDHPDLFHLRPAGKMRIISVEKKYIDHPCINKNGLDRKGLSVVCI